jgi:hypothetical protein
MPMCLPVTLALQAEYDVSLEKAHSACQGCHQVGSLLLFCTHLLLPEGSTLPASCHNYQALWCQVGMPDGVGRALYAQ